jgi:hypothetical protein
MGSLAKLEVDVSKFTIYTCLIKKGRLTFICTYFTPPFSLEIYKSILTHHNLRLFNLFYPCYFAVHSIARFHFSGKQEIPLSISTNPIILRTDGRNCHDGQNDSRIGLEEWCHFKIIAR